MRRLPVAVGGPFATSTPLAPELLALDRNREAEAPTPGAIAELAQQEAMGGLHLDGRLVNTEQFERHLIGLRGLIHLSGRHLLAGLQLLAQLLESLLTTWLAKCPRIFFSSA